LKLFFHPQSVAEFTHFVRISFRLWKQD